MCGSGTVGRPRMSPNHSAISPFPGRRMVLTADLWIVPGDCSAGRHGDVRGQAPRGAGDLASLALTCTVMRGSAWRRAAIPRPRAPRAWAGPGCCPWAGPPRRRGSGRACTARPDPAQLAPGAHQVDRVARGGQLKGRGHTGDTAAKGWKRVTLRPLIPYAWPSVAGLEGTRCSQSLWMLGCPRITICC